MKDHQKKFYSFIMERVEEAHKEDAEKLLLKSFEKQDNGTFNLEFLQKFGTAMEGFLKSENKEEVLNVMKQFKMQFQR